LTDGEFFANINIVYVNDNGNVDGNANATIIGKDPFLVRKSSCLLLLAWTLSKKGGRGPSEKVGSVFEALFHAWGAVPGNASSTIRNFPCQGKEKTP
jgi:hypothetical protein